MKKPLRRICIANRLIILARKLRFAQPAARPRQLQLHFEPTQPAWRSWKTPPRWTWARLGALLAGLILMASCHGGPGLAPNVWARVDGQPIYRRQVESIYQQRRKAGNDAADSEEAANFKLNILNDLINDQVLLNDAQRSQISVSEAQVDRRLAQLKSPYSPQEFAQKLQQEGMTLDELRREIKTSLIVHRLINRDIEAHISVSQAEIAAYYKRNQASFDVPETEYHLAQIEVTPYADPEVRNLKDDDAKTPVDAQRKIKALYAQLRAGASFRALAENYSEDPRTALSGGDMGFIPLSALNADPTLKKIVTSLKPGQISGIVQTRSGYHIVKLLGIEKAGQRTLSDPQVVATIRNTLMSEKTQLLKAAFLEVLRDRAHVRNYYAERILKQEGVALR